MEFVREYPDDATCLEWLWRTRFSPDGEHAFCPDCDRSRKFTRYATKQRRQSWTCTACGHHIHPTAGTIFEKSSTSLHLWFFAIYIMSSTRCGVSAKQLERELGVTYKTAWRMMNLIRTKLMAQDDEPLSGTVEVDETFVGGKPRMSHLRVQRAQGIEPYSPESRAWHAKRKQTVFGVVARKGQVRATVVPDSLAETLRPEIQERVIVGSTIYSDDYKGYAPLTRQGYSHAAVPHAQKIYVSGDVHTNTIEGFFALVKNGIRGVYHSVSPKWLQGYLNEYAWRYNHRDDDRAQFESLILAAAAGS